MKRRLERILTQQKKTKLESSQRAEESPSSLHSPAIIANILQFLTPSEICFNLAVGEDATIVDIKPLYIVCKSWFETIHSETFCRSYMNRTVCSKALFTISEKEELTPYKIARMNLLFDQEEGSWDFSKIYEKTLFLRALSMFHNSNEYLTYLSLKSAIIANRNKGLTVRDWTEPLDDLIDFVGMIAQHSKNIKNRLEFYSNLFTQYSNLGGDQLHKSSEVKEIFQHLNKWGLSGAFCMQSSKDVLTMKFSDFVYCRLEEDTMREYLIFRDSGEPILLSSTPVGISINGVCMLKVNSKRGEDDDLYVYDNDFPVKEFLGYKPNRDEIEVLTSFFTFFATNELVESDDE